MIVSVSDAPRGGVLILLVHKKQQSSPLGSGLSWALKCSVPGQSTLGQKFLSVQIAGIGKKQVSVGLDFLLESGSLEWFACLHYQKVASGIFLFDINTNIWIASSSVKSLVFTFMATISRWTLISRALHQMLKPRFMIHNRLLFTKMAFLCAKANTEPIMSASNVKTQVYDPKPPAVHKDGTQECSGLFFSIGMTYRQTIRVYSWPICTMWKYHLLWWCQSQH